jgi:hypothetical protein
MLDGRLMHAGGEIGLIGRGEGRPQVALPHTLNVQYAPAMGARAWTIVDYVLMFGAAGCAAVLLAIGIVLAWRSFKGEPLPDNQPLERH